MNLIESIKNLGLNEKEAKVYLALLQLGTSTAYNVAVRSGLKKPTTYVVLNQLVEKGFAYKVPRAKKQRFRAESPEACWLMMKERMNFTKEALPELMALKKGSHGETKVSVAYFEGVRGAEELYGNLFRTMKALPQNERKFAGFYAKADETSQELEAAFDRINETMQSLGIKRRVLTVFHPSIMEKYLKPELMAKLNMTAAKALLPEKYSSNVSIEVYGHYVQILSQKSLQGILIEDGDTAQAIGQIFEMVWDLVDKDREHYVGYAPVFMPW